MTRSKLRVDTTGKLTATLTDDTGLAVVGATVELTLLDEQRSELVGVVWPIAMTDEADGTYTAKVNTVAQPLALTPGTRLIARVVAVNGADRARTDEPVTVTLDED